MTTRGSPFDPANQPPQPQSASPLVEGGQQADTDDLTGDDLAAGYGDERKANPLSGLMNKRTAIVAGVGALVLLAGVGIAKLVSGGMKNDMHQKAVASASLSPEQLELNRERLALHDAEVKLDRLVEEAEDLPDNAQSALVDYLLPEQIEAEDGAEQPKNYRSIFFNNYLKDGLSQQFQILNLEPGKLAPVVTDKVEKASEASMPEGAQALQFRHTADGLNYSTVIVSDKARDYAADPKGYDATKISMCATYIVTVTNANQHFNQVADPSRTQIGRFCAYDDAQAALISGNKNDFTGFAPAVGTP